MSSKQAYQKIMKQNGLEQVKALVRKWEALSENMAAKPSGLPIILPDLLFVAQSGTGRTHCVKLLAEYLSENGTLMDFYGDVKYFEFMLNYCSPGEHFSELPRLMTEIDNAAGFRNEYRGIIFIDIDEWRGHTEEKHFVSFLEYLSDNSDGWLVVLSVSDRNTEQVEQMEAVLSAFLRIERIVIEKPLPQELTDYAAHMLLQYGITLKQDAEALLLQAIEVLCKNKYFDGYKTIRMLCQDIAYAAYIAGKQKARRLDAEDLAQFAAGSEYISRMIVKIEKTARIGF